MEISSVPSLVTLRSAMTTLLPLAKQLSGNHFEVVSFQIESIDLHTR